MKNTTSPYPQAQWLWVGKHIILYTTVLIYTFVICLLTPFFMPFSLRKRYVLGTLWSFLFIKLLKILFKLDYKVTGLNNLPRDLKEGPAVMLSNHHSAWETTVFPYIFPPQTWAVKRELFWIPFFGWLIWYFKAISIHRQKSGSLPQLLAQGKALLKQNIWVAVFPQGTRVDPGQHKRYTKGGAVLACENQVPVVTVAHNAGAFWPKGWLIKKTGTVQVHIGPVIYTTPDTNPEDLNRQASEWIEGTVKKLYT